MKCASAVTFRNSFLWKAALTWILTVQQAGNQKLFFLCPEGGAIAQVFGYSSRAVHAPHFDLPPPSPDRWWLPPATSKIPAWCHVGSWRWGCLSCSSLSSDCRIVCLALKTCRFLPAGGLVLPKLAISPRVPSCVLSRFPLSRQQQVEMVRSVLRGPPDPLLDAHVGGSPRRPGILCGGTFVRFRVPS